MFSKKSKSSDRRIEPSAEAIEPMNPVERIAAINKQSMVSLIDHRRRAQRSSLKMIGEMSFGTQSHSVYVLDGAVGGLRLKLYDNIDVPKEFWLKIPSLGFDQKVFLAWHREMEIGVEF